MAGKCKEMNKIKQALRLHLDGESNRSIGRQLDLYKGTVNKYITLAESCGIPHYKSGRTTLFRLQEIEAWIERSQKYGLGDFWTKKRKYKEK